ncbi:MAG: hypothetical protein ACOC2D_07345, partial [Spirochaetota bacterium]
MSDERRYQQIENREWIDSLDYVLDYEGAERAEELLSILHQRAQRAGVRFTVPSGTPYLNTIPKVREKPYPGSRDMERRI